MNEISIALVKAQKAFGPALKTSTNPHFRSKYADLSACVEAVIDALNNNGIMLMQPTHLCEDGVIIETLFIHESGQQMSAGKLHVPASKHDAQGYGSALSYARRYSLMAACGIAPEDDDGNHATAAVQQRKAAPVKQSEPPKQAPSAPKQSNAPAKMEGKEGAWQIKISAEPETTFDDWVSLVLEMTDMALQNAGSVDDVMNIFRTNRAIYERVQKEPGAGAYYENILKFFSEAKAKYKKEEA